MIQLSNICVAVRQVAILGSYLAVLFALYLVPLGMYSPCIKEEGTLGPAPILIGHRGAPMVKATNTPSTDFLWCLFDFAKTRHRSSDLFIFPPTDHERLTVFIQLAPENTQMSFRKAVEAGGTGLETDVTIRWVRCLSYFLHLSFCFFITVMARTVTQQDFNCCH